MRFNGFVLFFILGFSVTAFSGQLCRRIFLNEPKVRVESEIKELRFMTFNVLNFFRAQGKFEWLEGGRLLPSKNEFHKYPEIKELAKIEETARLINQENPDYIVVQEIESEIALAHFNDSYLKKKYSTLFFSGNDSRIGIGILIKRDLPWFWRAYSHAHHRWIHPGTKKETPVFSRDLPVIEVRRNETDHLPLFVLIGNHAKSKRDSPSDPESFFWRSEQYRKAQEIIEHFHQAAVPVLFAGDFNTDVRNAPELKNLKKIMTASMELGDSPIPLAERITHTYHPFEGKTVFSQLDEYFVSNEIAPFVKGTKILRYQMKPGVFLPYALNYKMRSQQPSDHLPVSMTFDLQAFLLSKH